MRDPRRIEEILSLLKTIWLENPDLRFHQLIYNLQRQYSLQNEGEGEVVEVSSDGFKRIGFDLFNLEDDLFVRFLRTKVL